MPDDIDLYERLYYAEWERREQLQNAVATPTGVLTLLGGALVLLAQRFNSEGPILRFAFWILFFLAVAAFSVAVGFLIRSFYGWTYRRIPYPSQLRSFEVGLIAHHEAAGGGRTAAQKELGEFLIERYTEAGDRNAANNVRRADFLHKANGWLVGSLAAVAATSIPFVVASRSVPAVTPQQVEIVGYPQPVRLEMSNDEQATPAPAPSENLVVPPKPTPPPNIDVRGDVPPPEHKIRIPEQSQQ